jgi:hypothetical protein
MLWMASAEPGNTSHRKAVDMHCNLGVLLDKKWISNTIGVHVQFSGGVSLLKPMMSFNIW